MVTREYYEMTEKLNAAIAEYGTYVNAGKGVPGFLESRVTILRTKLSDANERQKSLVKQLEELAAILDNPAARDSQSRLVVIRLRPMAEKRREIVGLLNAYPPYLGGRSTTISFQASLG